MPPIKKKQLDRLQKNKMIGFAKNIFCIGTLGEHVVDSKKTIEQIEAVKKLDCRLTHDGQQLDWNAFDNPEQKSSLFQSILKDRKIRVDENTRMTYWPPFCVVTARENKGIRLEYYEGNDSLLLAFDFRSKELKGKKLPNFRDVGPSTILKDVVGMDLFGNPEDITRPILDEPHEKKKDKIPIF